MVTDKTPEVAVEPKSPLKSTMSNDPLVTASKSVSAVAPTESRTKPALVIEL